MVIICHVVKGVNGSTNITRRNIMDIIKAVLFTLLLSAAAYSIAADPVDINSADKEALMTVKGVGERRAEAIISYRENYGPFDSIEELMEIEGIGKATVDANRDILVVNQKK
jgi:competence protein ComEA